MDCPMTGDADAGEAMDTTQLYDRQVRLWGDAAQSSISSARICVLGSTALASEVLKSLVLAGIRHFHIVDSAVVKESDLEQNFFVTDEQLGRPRAEVVAELLAELNPSVSHSFDTQSFNPSESDINSPNWTRFLTYHAVVATNLPDTDAAQLAPYLSKHEIPFIHAKVVGLVGYARLVYNQHVVWNNHREADMPHDLRLDAPFEALLKAAEECDLETMSYEQHSHTPYLLLYLKALEKWNGGVWDGHHAYTNSNGSAVGFSAQRGPGSPADGVKRIKLSKENSDSTGSVQHSQQPSTTAVNWPDTYKKRKEFEAILMEMLRPDEHGITGGEENFAEAKKNLFKSFGGSKIPDWVEEVLHDPKAENPADYLSSSASTLQNPMTRQFWLFAAALHQFVHNHGGLLPLSGPLPDMTSDSKRYTHLLSIYREKALSDAEEIFQLAKLLDPNGVGLASLEQCREWCKNATRVAVHNAGSALSDEYGEGKLTSGSIVKSVLSAINCPSMDEEGENTRGLEPDPLVWYVLLKARERFHQAEGRHPTHGVDEKALEKQVKKIIHESEDPSLIASASRLVPIEAIAEMCSSEETEPHVIAAIMGGVVAQETIKLVTHQFSPIDNTFIFDGATQKSASFKV